MAHKILRRNSVGGRRPLYLLGALALVLSACGGSDDNTLNTGGTSGSDAGVGGSGGSTGGSGGTAGSGGATGGTSGEAGAAGLGGTGGSTGGSGGSTTGCATEDDCAATPQTPYCNVTTGYCVACEAGNADHACPVGFTCCSEACIDTGADPANCGACDNPCVLPNASATCSAGLCVLDSCESGFADCDGDATNGCETSTAGGGCACAPGETQPCYSGPAGTEDVGPCHGGTRTCDASGSAWGACVGEVIPASDSCLNSEDDDCDGVMNNGYPNATACLCLPGESRSCYTGPAGTETVGTCHTGTETCVSAGTGYTLCTGEVTPTAEVCGNGQDEDCNGVNDDSLDQDGDGWTVCQGDCCDQIGPACGSPSLVNPGAVEVAGDSVDNNCNGQIDENPVTACSTGSKFAGTTAWDLLRAMEICQDAATGTWGVVGTPTITRADGSGAGSVSNDQIAVTTQFGTDASNLPQAGPNFAMLSSGRARDGNDPNATTSQSYQYVSGNPPADFVAPHGGQLPSTGAGCPNGSGANDSAVLDVQLKVPTNANSFSFQFRFFSQEYWTWTCTAYNDFFVALLDSTWTPQPGGTAIPADKNISFDANGNYISVNSQQFFTVCPPKTGYPCPDGTAGLNGTGYTLGPGGGTVWLTTTSPVVPGETVHLRFAIWDTSDELLDSIVAIDNFQWSATPSDGPVTE
jgi:Putative metal-binding motif